MVLSNQYFLKRMELSCGPNYNLDLPKFLIFIAVANQTCLIPLIILDAFIQQPRLLLNHSFKALFLFPTLQFTWRDDL